LKVQHAVMPLPSKPITTWFHLSIFLFSKVLWLMPAMVWAEAVP